ncbi:MAG: ATP-binding protein [Lewinellaceae bacterium]|nr:ATP-binding protein [Lewinellaceae bacterium]
MKQVSIKQVENAFLPAKEISDPDKFAGREEYVKAAYLSLLTEGSNIAIVGNRGIGKSSLARQIINISQGDNRILERLDIHADQTLDYLTVYLACGKSIKTVDNLLEKLLTTRDCLLEWVYEIPSATKEVDKLNSSLGASSSKIGNESIEETTRSSVIQGHSTQTIFQNVISDLLKSKVSEDGILIVIDEFDQIEDPRGFASLIKSLATNTPGLRFCIVGVAQDIQNLMKEHESSDRLFAGSIINLPSMSGHELQLIIENAERSIDGLISFNDEAKSKIVSLSQGHPYITHLIGKQSFRTAYFEGRYEEPLNLEFIEETLKSIAEKETDPVLEGRYKKAVASSPAREIVLKVLAGHEGTNNEIFTTDAYKEAIDLGVDNPSQYVGHLVTEDYGKEIVKIRDKYYRFRDSLFKSYVLARPSLYNE